jgi:hypothetical protein
MTIVTDGCAKRTTFFGLDPTDNEEFTAASPIVSEIPDMSGADWRTGRSVRY